MVKKGIGLLTILAGLLALARLAYLIPLLPAHHAKADLARAVGISQLGCLLCLISIAIGDDVRLNRSNLIVAAAICLLSLSAVILLASVPTLIP
jgi:hypothetical protein